MGKAHVTAIIQALQETIENLSVNGCSARSKISNKTVDSQYVQALEDDYGDDIQDIIDEIPDDPPVITLPTVSISGDFGTNLFKFNTSGSDYTFNAGVTTSIYRYDTGEIETYDQSKNYATVRCINAASQVVTRTGVEIVNWNGSLWCHNISGSTLVVAYIKVAVCSSNEATVITVYNSSNEAFNSFKYTVDGTDYYYVLDGTQTDWTDDLSSIGYSLTKSLPTVSKNSASASRTSGTVSPAPDGTALLWDSGSAIAYDQNTVCCVSGYYVLPLYGGGEWQYGRYFDAINQDGYLYAKNITDSTISNISYFSYAVCSNNTATVVTVYDSSNNSYNAFKYTQDGTDYYYVLDGVQTGWTSDLSSIGYSLTPVITLPTIWQSRASVSPSNQTIAVDGISLLSRDGQIIQYYSDYSYAFRRWVKFTTTDRSPGEIISNAGYLAVKNTGTSDVTGVYNVDYAACSSNQAEVVTVYNSSNEAFNAFKFTASGVDYYYVLDEVQTDWTDDLSSIGYFIQIIGYFKTSGASATTNESVSYRYWYTLYKADSSSGSVKYLTGDSTKTYLPIAAVKADGTTIDVTNGYMQTELYSGVSDVIQFKPATSIDAHHLLFKET